MRGRSASGIGDGLYWGLPLPLGFGSSGWILVFTNRVTLSFSLPLTAKTFRRRDLPEECLAVDLFSLLRSLNHILSVQVGWVRSLVNEYNVPVSEARYVVEQVRWQTASSASVLKILSLSIQYGSGERNTHVLLSTFARSRNNSFHVRGVEGRNACPWLVQTFVER